MTLTEGAFILTVSLSGNYNDLEFVGYFDDCETAIEYYYKNCSEYQAASCLLPEYSNLPGDHLDVFGFEITEPQSCGFVGVDTRSFTKDK